MHCEACIWSFSGSAQIAQAIRACFSFVGYIIIDLGRG
jgi:hypothetical protein